MLLHVPDTRGSVVASGGKVIAKWSEFEVPNWELVTVVNNEAGTSLQGPASDGAVVTSSYQKLIVYGNAEAVDRPRVSH